MNIVEITNQEEFWKLFNEDKPLLIDFYAEWCAPCKSLSPVFEELSRIYNENLTVVKVDIEANPEIAQKFMVRSIPTVVTSKSGEIEKGVVGAKPANFYKQMAEEVINS
tara:strand:- start:576 stop:902 length:327 start_codon:yes stop_codon:yes gene_type:complete